MMREPWSDIGRLQSDIQDLKSQISQCAKSYEVQQTNSTMDGIQHSIRELSSALDELRFGMQELQESVIDVTERLEVLEEVNNNYDKS